MKLISVELRLKFVNIMVIISVCICCGVYLDSSVVVLGIVVFSLMFVSSCSIVILNGECVCVVMIVNMLNRNIDVISMCLCLNWLVFGLVSSVLIMSLIGVVFIISLNLGCEIV